MHGFGPQRFPTLQQSSFFACACEVGVLGLSHELYILYIAMVAAWANAILRLIPLGDCALKTFRLGLLPVSTDFGMRWTGELTSICEEAAFILRTSCVLSP